MTAVVMSADLSIMGLQRGCLSFSSAATPLVCGQAMLVPAGGHHARSTRQVMMRCNSKESRKGGKEAMVGTHQRLPNNTSGAHAIIGTQV